MKQIFLNRKINKGILMVVLLQVLAALFVSVVFGGVEMEEFSGKDSALVTGKGPNCIALTNHAFKIDSGFVTVTSRTSIVDVDGKHISFKDLKIPCIAKIKLYRRPQRIPEVEGLQVIKYDGHASAGFTMGEKTFKRRPY